MDATHQRDDEPPTMPRAGDVVGDKYLLARVLGEGGMGVVYEAVHLKLRQRVAVKFIHPEALAMPDAIDRFEREARATRRTRSPHVAHVLDVDTTHDGLPYMVMELLEGHDLEVELRDRRALPTAEAVDYLIQACAAVSAAHAAGIVHRDLKPSNLFLCSEKERRSPRARRVVKVLDFGISMLDGDADTWTATTEAVTVGTPMYMSPEQVRSSKDIDGRTDIWSLGVILFEMLAGGPPFLGATTAAIAAIVADATPSLRARHPHVPRELERVILKAMAKCPDDRFPSADAFAAALAPFASEEGLVGRARALSRLGRAPRSVALGAVAGAFAIVAAATILISRSVDRPEPGAANAALLAPVTSDPIGAKPPPPRGVASGFVRGRLAAPARTPGVSSPRSSSHVTLAPTAKRPLDR